MSAATNLAVAKPRASPDETVEFRRRVSSISRHSVVYFAGVVFSAAAGYVFKIYLARALGAEALGIYALGISVVSAVGVFNAAGLPMAGSRFVAEYSARNDYARLGAFLRGVFAVLGFGNVVLGTIFALTAPWIAVRFFHAPALASYSWAFAAIMLLGVLNTFLGQCMAGYRAVARRSLITQFAGSTTTIAVAVALISLHFGLAGYLAAQVASATLVFALLGFSVWKLTPPPARSTDGLGRFEKRVLAFSATSFGIAFVHFLLAQSDKLTLGHYVSIKEVGIYAVVMTMVGLVPTTLTSVNQIFSPTIAELHTSGDHFLLQRLYATLTKWVLTLTMPLALAVIIFSPSWMSIFGPAFREGSTALAIGTLGQIVNCAVGSVGFLLLMSENQVALMKIEAVNAIAMVVLNLLLVPRFGILGAAIAMSVAVVGTNLWCLAAVRSKLRLFPYDRSYAGLVVATLLTATLLLILHGFWGQGTWRLAAATLAMSYASFFGGVLLTGLGPDDRMLLRMALERIRGNGESDESFA